jgi:hemoglobin
VRPLIPMLILTMLAGCASAPPRRLYDELGGQAGIQAIAAGLVARVVANPRIGHHFEHVDLANLEQKLAEQFCAEADGPCTYTGQDMQLAHAGRNISDAEFDALVEDLLDAMEAQGVPTGAQNRLLRRLAAMHADVVYQ